MEFRVCTLISMLLCAAWTISATPTRHGACLETLNDSGTTEQPNTGNVKDLVSMSNLTTKQHHMQRRTVDQRRRVTASAESEQATQRPTPPTVAGGSEIVDAIRLATLLPADILSLVRMLLVPAINTTLAVPASILEQLSNSTFLTELGNGGLLSGLEGNASRWLHLNGSSPQNGSMISSLSLPKMSMQLPFQSAANSSSGGRPYQSLFNATRAGNAARTAALFGERLLLFPVSSLLSLALPGGQRSLPATLNDAHLRRYFADLTRFLGAERATTTAAPGGDEVTTTTGAPPETESS